jgi:tetratricopeptide (TPR) repeat protein
MRTVVLDTNVLLSDPDVLLSLRDAEVVIPETVLSELDKLKTSRVDPDLRFRGREVSRLLFELSEQGNLIEGVGLPDGGLLRVMPLSSDKPFPDELSPKNADDRILAVALQLRERDDLVLVTNDLNMLLKAQTLGVEVQRHFDGVESTFMRRFVVRPFQRYKVPIGILAIALAVFAAIVFLAVYNPLNAGQQQIPQEFKDQLTTGQRDVLDSLTTLQRNPNDTTTEVKLANTYFDLAQNGHLNNAMYATYAVQHYQHVLQLQPDNSGARVDMAVCEFQWLGQTDQAIQDTVYVLQKTPDHLQANFNLGIFYWQGRHDYRSAEAQFNKVIELTKSDSQQQQVLKDAQARLAAVKQEESQATTRSAGTTATKGTQ